MHAYVKVCDDDIQKDNFVRLWGCQYDVSITDLVKLSTGKWVIGYLAPYERY
jgi:hypothetical protein